MAKKKKFGASLKQQVDLLPIVKEKAPKTISTNVSTGGMRSAVSSTTQSVAKSARQKAEEERSARMRQGLSSVVRSSFNRQMSRPTYINKNTVNRLNQLNKTVTNPLAPIKQKQVTGGNGVGGQRLFSKERSLLNNTKFVTGGQGVGGETVVNSPIGRVKSSVLAPVKEDIQNNYYDAVRKVGMKGSRNERKIYVPLSQRDENGQISTNQRRLENAARGGNRKAQVEAALARTKAQTLMNGHTYDQIVNAELNKRGLMGQDYILRNLAPTEEAMEYRKRYGFDEEAKQAMLDLVNKNNGMNFGHDEAYRAAKVEDTLRRQYGVELTPEEQAQIDEARSSAGYMFGNMVGQGEQFALTAPASGLVEGKLLTKFGLKNGLKSIRGVDDALKYAGARIGADQIVSAPVNLLDALKEDNGADIIKRFGMNTAMDMIFSGLTEIPSLRKNVRFGKAYFLNQSANAMEEGAEKIATKQAAYNELLDAINENNAIESANNLDIYTEDLPSELTRYQANHLVDAPQTFDKPVSKVESTYDRHTKSYVIRLKDADGNNLGDPIRIGGKDRKNARVTELENQYGIQKPSKKNQPTATVEKANTKKPLENTKLANETPNVAKSRDEIARIVSKDEYTPDNLKELEDIAEKYLSKEERDDMNERIADWISDNNLDEDSYGKKLSKKKLDELRYDGLQSELEAILDEDPNAFSKIISEESSANTNAVEAEAPKIKSKKKNDGSKLDPKTKEKIDAIAEKKKAKESAEANAKVTETKEQPAQKTTVKKEKPKRDGHTEAGWKSIEKSYKKKSTKALAEEHEKVVKLLERGNISRGEADERIRLLKKSYDSKKKRDFDFEKLQEAYEKGWGNPDTEKFRYGAPKESQGKANTQAADSALREDQNMFSEETRDFTRERVENEGTANKQTRGYDKDFENTRARYDKDPVVFEDDLMSDVERLKKGKLPKKADTMQDFFDNAAFFIQENEKKMKKFVKDSDDYRRLQLQNAKIIEGAFQGGSQMGAGLNHYKLFAGSNDGMKDIIINRSLERLEEKFDKRLKKYGIEELDLPPELRQAIKDAKTPDAVAKAWADASIHVWNQIPASFKDKADFFRVNAMLLNPKTHIRNIFGNLFFAPMRELKDVNGTIIEATLEKFGKLDKSARRKSFRPDKEGMEYAKKILEENGEALRGANKLLEEISNGRPINEMADMFMAGRHDVDAPIRKGIWKALDGLGHINSKLLDGEDMKFFDIAFRRQYGRVMKARGLSVQDLVDNPRLRDEITELSASEALRAVYRDNSAVSKAFSKWKHPKNGNALQKAVGIGIDSVMPFTKTPINIVRRALEFSPAGGIEGFYHMAKGFHNANPKMIVRGIDELSSGVTGSAIMAAGYFFGMYDHVTVKLGDDDESKFMREIGKQNFSVSIGSKDNNVSVTLDWLAPGCIPFFTGAAVANALGEDSGVNVWEVMDVAEQMFEPMVEMSVMQGIKNTLESFQKESGGGVMQGLMSAGLNSGLSYIGQFNPTIVGQINKTFFDHTRRDTSSTASESTKRTVERWWNKQVAKWPVFSQLLPEYKNVWAETQSNTWSKNPAGVFLENFWSPGYIKDYKPDSVEKELIDVYEKDKTVEGLFPQKNWKGQVSYNGGTLKLEKKEVSAYNDIYGKTSKNKLKELFASSAYKNASLKDKQKMIKEVYEEANTEATQKVLLDRGYDKWEVLTDDLSASQKKYGEAKKAGLTPEEYRKYAKTTDYDLNGNGKAYKSEWAIYLNSQDLTDEERAALWSLRSEAANPYLDGTAHTTDWQAQYQKDLKSSDKRLATNLGKVKAREGGVASSLFNKTVDKELENLKAKGITPSSSNNSSGNSGRSRSGRRGGSGGSRKARVKTASEKKFSNLQKMKAPTTGKGIEALSQGAKGLTKAQKKALIKLLQKKLDV